MALRIEIDYEGKTYRSAPILEPGFEEVCKGFNDVIEELTFLKATLDDGSALYMAKEAATRAVIRVIQE